MKFTKVPITIELHIIIVNNIMESTNDLELFVLAAMATFRLLFTIFIIIKSGGSYFMFQYLSHIQRTQQHIFRISTHKTTYRFNNLKPSTSDAWLSMHSSICSVDIDSLKSTHINIALKTEIRINSPETFPDYIRFYR